ncbi:MAG TPA: chemotaxis protein CheB [Gemmatimonadales bacterium]|nr:chemotaxis protein CheB [Gemmatimonadales bacterium]
MRPPPRGVTDTHSEPGNPERFPIVGVGASAGGLAAFTQFLQSLPAEPGVACVLIQHLDPNYPSELPHILTSSTGLVVRSAEEGHALRPNCVYVLPANALLTVSDGRFRLTPRTAGHPFAIDHFLNSLAADRGPDSIGVVLSGSGSDGAAGLRAIKTAGGTTFAQDPDSAEHGDMPRNAIESGAVDHVLPAGAIGRAILDPAMRGPVPAREDAQSPRLSDGEADALDRIKELLRETTGVDFRHYKSSTLRRRMERRLAQRGVAGLPSYLELLRRDPGEAAALYRDVLLHVTGFFRDPDALAALKDNILTALMASRRKDVPLRIWVPACSSGEEVYSIGICALEARGMAEFPIQIFATDLSEQVLETARRGVYPLPIRSEVSQERLERFFVETEAGFQVRKSLRDLCVFSRHDVIEDPPFARLDLISCRNLLIYFDPVLQVRVLHVFHYALKPGGFLMLGPAESIGVLDNLFGLRDRTAKVYVRHAGPSRLPPTMSAPLTAGIDRPGGAAQRASRPRDAMEQAVDAVVLKELAAPSVLVDGALEVVQFRGRTTPYLTLPEGQPSAKVLKLAHPELRVHLGRLLRKARADQRPASGDGITFRDGAQERMVNLRVLPVPLNASEEPHLLVVFQPGPAGRRRAAAGADRPEAMQGLIDDLQRELGETRDYLQGLIDEQDRIHAELQAAHEDSLSINEEFQSTNEELVTTKEEIQSVNEELTTINEELRRRNLELQGLNSDLANVLESVRIPILICDRDLYLRRYSPSAEALFGLSGLPARSRLIDVRIPIPGPDLDRLCRSALEGGRPDSEQIQDREGVWREIRSWPYRDQDGQTVGVVLAMVDIDELYRATGAAGRARDRSAAIIEAVAHPLVVLDGNLRIRETNRAFDETFPQRPGEAGALLVQRAGGLWDAPSLAERLTALEQSGQGFEDLEITGQLEPVGSRVFRLSGRQIAHPESESADILLAIEDVTALRLRDRRLLDAAKLQAMGQIAGGVAHEINNQMQGVLGFSRFLLKDLDPEDPRAEDLNQILKAGLRAAEVTRNLLAYSGRQMLQPEPLILDDVIGDIVPFVRQILGPAIALEVSPGSAGAWVHAERAALEQVIVNLTLNARDAMPNGGRLGIETARVDLREGDSTRRGVSVAPGSYVRILFSDSGRGMDQATLERAFEPFYTTKPVGEGTGLGLASAYGTVKQSGGYIWLRSSPDKGTEITIDLPVFARGRATEKDVVPSLQPPRGSETVLVVDDEVLVRAWLCRILETLGYAPLAAGSGTEALALIEGGAAVDLLVADVVMPGMGGRELGERVAALLPGVPVMFISGFNRDQIVGQGLLDEHASLLRKPFTVEEVAIEVRTLLDASVRPPAG